VGRDVEEVKIVVVAEGAKLQRVKEVLGIMMIAPLIEPEWLQK
jgi:hypothetical protein